MLQRFAPHVLAGLLLCMSHVAPAENYALLIGIGDYPQMDIADEGDLPGTMTDLATYKTLAKKLGVQDKHLFMLQNREAKAGNLLGALDELTGMVSEKDNVLVAYSGHGAQIHDPDSQQANQCSEGIVSTQNDKPILIGDQLLREKFDALSEKAGKVLVFFDSCFSGGALTTRSLHGSIDPDFKPRMKMYRAADLPHRAVNQCGKAVNRSLSLARGLTTGKQNMVFFAAAAQDEVAIDTGERYGGMATLSWMACLNEPATDKDKSGAISGAELHACAQDLVRAISVDKMGRQDSVQHVQIEGNKAVTIAFAEPPRPDQASASTATGTGSAIAGMMDIYHSRNPRWEVGFSADKAVYRIGQEAVELAVQSARAGYAYIFMVGTEDDGKGLTLLFPNERDMNNRIEAGQPLALPRQDKWRLMPGGPAGVDQLLLVVTPQAVDLSKAGLRGMSIFKQSGSQSIDLARVQRTLTRSLVVEAPEASDSSYGAALLKIIEAK